MNEKNTFTNSVEYFYQSLSDSIAKRMQKLDLRPVDVTRDDPKRAKAVMNNKRSERHRTLIGRSEYSYFVKLFRFETNYDFKRSILDEHKFTKEELDRMLWGHIDWNRLYQLIMKDFESILMKPNNQLLKLFELSLLNYVPYAIQKAHVEKFDNPFSDYFTFKMPMKRNVGGDVLEYYDFELEHYESYEKFMIVRQDAIKWVYFKDIESKSELLKEDFISPHKSLAVGEFVEDFLTLSQRSRQEYNVGFAGETLWQFDDKFEKFAFSWVEKLIKQNQPQANSFGYQAYIYAKQLLETMEFNDLTPFEAKANGGLMYVKPQLVWDGVTEEFVPNSEELVDVVSDYLNFANNHLKGLEKFQKEFDW